MDSKFLPFFFFSTGLAGLGVSIVLISSKKYLAQNFYLSLCVFSLSLCSVYNFCYMEGVLADLPFLFIVAKSVTYLVAPSAYLYIRNVFYPLNMYRKYDWINFMPFVVVILALTNLSLRNPEAIQRALTDSSVNWFINVAHAGLYYNLCIAKSVLWLFYTFLQSLCIINFERKRHTLPLHYNYRLINWVKVFNITLIVLFSSLLVQRIINISFISLDFVSDTTMSVILLITLFFLISNPHILYSLEHIGLNLSVNTPAFARSTSPKVAADKQETSVKPLFNSKKKDEYMLILDDVLKQTKPFLNKGITVKDLSDQTGIPAHHLSSLISTEFKLHFQDFINLRRIEYLKNNIDDIEWKQLTLEGICWEIGFTSRTTFFRAFIKFTGLSPSEYFNSLKKNKHRA
jgi:AraC-like DNA-binding protein